MKTCRNMSHPTGASRLSVVPSSGRRHSPRVKERACSQISLQPSVRRCASAKPKLIGPLAGRSLQPARWKTTKSIGAHHVDNPESSPEAASCCVEAARKQLQNPVSALALNQTPKRARSPLKHCSLEMDAAPRGRVTASAQTDGGRLRARARLRPISAVHCQIHPSLQSRRGKTHALAETRAPLTVLRSVRGV